MTLLDGSPRFTNTEGKTFKGVIGARATFGCADGFIKGENKAKQH